MAIYKVLKEFKDKETGEIYSPGSKVKFTVKRANEVEENLKDFGGNFIERVEDKAKD